MIQRLQIALTVAIVSATLFGLVAVGGVYSGSDEQQRVLDARDNQTQTCTYNDEDVLSRTGDSIIVRCNTP